MATKHNYYSLKGKVTIFERDANGKPINGEFIGNATEATFSMTREVVELRESYSGTNAIVAEEERSKDGTLSVTTNSFAAKNLARICYGNIVAQAAGTVSGESLGAFAEGESKALDKVNVTDVVLTAGGDTLIAGTHYTINGKTGLITALAELTGVAAAYNHGAADAIGIFTNSGKEYFVRFDANTADGGILVVEFPRWKPNPATNIGLISQDFANFQLSGKVLFDDTIPEGSALGQFGRIYKA